MNSENELYRVAIVGCGLIGEKRAKNLGRAQLAMAVDTNLDRAKSLAKNHAVASSDWRDVLKSQEVDIVIVATPNRHLAEISLASLKSNKHVLVEKPAACSCDELDRLIDAERQSGKFARVAQSSRAV